NGNGISGLEIGLRKNITEHVLKKAVLVYKDELESKTTSSVR
ncbi:22438_t:CDS:1, partial [Gigaspora rosea]